MVSNVKICEITSSIVFLFVCLPKIWDSTHILKFHQACLAKCFAYSFGAMNVCKRNEFLNE